MNEATAFYQKKWFIWLMVFFFWPVGLFLLWKFGNYSTKIKGAITAFFACICLVALISPPTPPANKPVVATTQEKQIEQEEAKKAVEEASQAKEAEEAKQKASEEVAKQAAVKQKETPQITPKAAPPQVKRDGPGPNGETIKGNITNKGEKIYHVPGGRFYNKTNPEAWFFTAEEARAAGYRASKR